MPDLPVTSLEPISEADRSRALETLTKSTPRRVMELAASRAQSYGLSIEKDLQPKTVKGLVRMTCRSLTISDCGEEPSTFRERKSAFRSRVLLLMQPMPDQMAARRIASLDLVTARREGKELDEDAKLAAYKLVLRRYPADIAAAALEAWVTLPECAGRFFPTAAEIHELARHDLEERQMLLSALDTALADRKARLEPRRRWKLSPDEMAASRARVQETVDALLKRLRAKGGRPRPKGDAVMDGPAKRAMVAAELRKAGVELPGERT